MSFTARTSPAGLTATCTVCGVTSDLHKTPHTLAAWKVTHVCDLRVVRAKRAAANRPSGGAA